MTNKNIQKLAIFVSLLALAACSKAPPVVGVKVGKPYEVNGRTYYPEPDDTYDEVGDGSWYGPGFHGKKTASGERFDENDITAAHPTLPMPSLVLVTNLKNDKSAVVRVNDRGPFHSNRIIDLSKKSAQLIGLKVTQPVRVKYLKKETEEYMQAFRAGEMDKLDMAEINKKYFEGGAQSQEDKMKIAQNNPAITPIPDVAIEDGDGTAPVSLIQSGDLAPIGSGKKSAFSLIKEAQADDELPPQKEQPKKDLAVAKAGESNVLFMPQNIAQKPEVKNSVKAPAQAVSGKFIVIAGSFSSEGNAKNLVKKISGAGKTAIEKVAVGGKNLWRVQVVGLKDMEQAKKALNFVKKQGVADARISHLLGA